VETTLQKSQSGARRLTDAAIAHALGASPPLFCIWKRQGCPNSSVEAAQAWKTARVRKPLKNQARWGNQNGKEKALEKRIAKWNLQPKLKTDLTPELLAEVAACFVDGFNDEETGILCDVSPDTIKKWRTLGPLKKAEFSRKRHYLALIRDGTRRDWCRVAWWLERRYPLEFSRPEVAQAIRVSNQSTTSITQNLVVSVDVMKELNARATATRKTVRELFANHQQTRLANQPRALEDRGGQLGDANE
jgi:hypothetical protein